MNTVIDYEEVSQREGFSVEDLKQGYGLFLVDEGVLVIQKIDCLEGYGMQKFSSDMEAGEQALKDGYSLFTVDHDNLFGWYILDTPEQRKIVSDKGYM